MIDDAIGTDFFGEFIGKFSYYKSIANMGLKSQVKFVLKYVVKKILHKLGFKRK